MSRIFVNNIPKFVKQQQLKQHFKSLGEVTDCKIAKDQNGNSKKFGYVGFKDKNAAGLAQKNYDKTYLGVSKIRVEIAKTRSDEEKYGKKNNNKKESQKKIEQIKKQSLKKFDQYKKIVQEGVKKSWDDLVTPSNTNIINNKTEKQSKKLQVSNNNTQKSKKQRKQNKKQEKQNSKVKNASKSSKSVQVKAIKTPKLTQKNKKYVSQPLKIDQTRLYVTNIPYKTTQQQLKQQFKRFGNIKKIKLPVQYDGTTKGYAFITYQMPEEALRAFTQTDNKVIFGRIIHVKPAVQDIGEIIKTGKQADFQQKVKQLYGDSLQQKTSYKKKKKKQMRQKMNDTTSWNTLFLNPNTILQRMSIKLGLNKSQILLSQDLAPKMALAEAQVIQQTKQWMISQGINIQFMKLDRSACARSQKTLLVKNLNYRTTQAQLKQLFDFYGITNKILLAPNRAIAIVQYSTKQFAANALQNLQKMKFKNNFIYVQYAPVSMMKQQQIKQKMQKMQQQILQAQQLSKVIYIKNLNFQSLQASLFEFLSKTSQPKSVKIIKDKQGKSMGYGFAEFASNQQAIKVIKKLQNQILDGHKLILSMSKKRVQTQKYQKIKELKQKINQEEVLSTKLIVKNLAFQATKNDVKQLFKHFGSIKNIKLPKKMNGQHRGFGFVEYDSAQEAALAKQALSSAHLYGRKLVIQYQKGSQDEQNKK